MMYLTVSIGNSDDRLTQKEWKNFVFELDAFIKARATVHFFGGASNWESWQNVCWLVEIEEDKVENLKTVITNTRSRYKQDSAFVMVGEGHFI